MLHLIQMSSTCHSLFCWESQILWQAFLLRVALHLLSLQMHLFLFMHAARRYFFWDNCPGPEVILRNFSLGLSPVLAKTTQTTIAEAGMEQVSQLVNQVDSIGPIELYSCVLACN